MRIAAAPAIGPVLKAGIAGLAQAELAVPAIRTKAGACFIAMPVGAVLQAVIAYFAVARGASGAILGCHALLCRIIRAHAVHLAVAALFERETSRLAHIINVLAASQTSLRFLTRGIAKRGACLPPLGRGSGNFADFRKFAGESGALARGGARLIVIGTAEAFAIFWIRINHPVAAGARASIGLILADIAIAIRSSHGLAGSENNGNHVLAYSSAALGIGCAGLAVLGSAAASLANTERTNAAIRICLAEIP